MKSCRLLLFQKLKSTWNYFVPALDGHPSPATFNSLQKSRNNSKFFQELPALTGPVFVQDGVNIGSSITFRSRAQKTETIYGS